MNQGSRGHPPLAAFPSTHLSFSHPVFPLLPFCLSFRRAQVLARELRLAIKKVAGKLRFASLRCSNYEGV